MTWLANFLASFLLPILEGLVQKLAISKQVSDLQSQQNDLIKAVSALQAAKTPEQIQNAINQVAHADNSP